MDETKNVEGSHETASSGGVQGGLGRGLTVMPPSVDGTPKSISPARPESVVDETKNVEGSHETASSGGVQGGLGRGLTVTPPSCEEGCEKCAELDVLAWFVDRFITCTLKDPSTRQVALQLQQHKHFPQSCRKRGTNCRYGAPWFPAIRTIIQVPARLKFKLGEDELENEKIEARKVETENVQSAVKFVLEDEKFMEDAQCHREEEIETYLLHRDLDQKISCHLAHMDDKEYKIPTKDPDVLQDYRDNFDDVAQHSDMSREGLSERGNFHKSMWQAIPLREIKRERLDLVLKEAGIAGQTFEERNRVYEEALSVSFKRGYSVIVKRDLDEIFTNTYNPEWIKAWDANIDLSFCGDYFAVITYVTDYCMKDESGVLTFITEALKQNRDGSLRGKLGFVKDKAAKCVNINSNFINSIIISFKINIG